MELKAAVCSMADLYGLFINKFYLVSDDEFRLKLSKTGIKANLNCKLCYAFNRTSYIKRGEEVTQSTFEGALRKRIDNFIISKMDLINDDRIIDIQIEKSDTKKHLIIEMFSKGNIVLTDENYKIDLVYKPKEYRDRRIEVGAF